MSRITTWHVLTDEDYERVHHAIATLYSMIDLLEMLPRGKDIPPLLANELDTHLTESMRSLGRITHLLVEDQEPEP